MQCSRCQQDNPVADARFCPGCGAPAEHAEGKAPLAASYVDLQRELTEALEQLTATAEILGIISRSPADAHPVFDAIAVNAFRLCDADGVAVARYDGALLHLAAHHNIDRDAVARLNHQYPQAPSRDFPLGRAVLDGAVVHVPDLQAAVEFSGSVARESGAGSQVAIPLFHEGRVVGGIGISRWRRGPFPDTQIALLKTFADQAVIAIENVRLFTELQEKNTALTQAHAQVSESLEQQTATSDILRVISKSPTDVQPVFNALAESATQLCEAYDSVIWRRDRDQLLLVAHHGTIPHGRIGEWTIPLVRGSANGRAVLDGRTVHIADMQAEAGEFPVGSENARRLGHRTMLSVPLMREGIALGAISLRRTEARLFTDRQVALLQTFADQAVIAIENVRLFTELQEKNQALTQAHAQVSEALEQQTATGDILRVISQSQTDLHPVFEAIVRSAAQLCEATFAALHRFDGQLVTFEAHHGMTDQEIAGSRARFPLPIDRGTAVSRAILDARTIHIHDIGRDPEYRVSAWQTSFRTVLAPIRK